MNHLTQTRLILTFNAGYDEDGNILFQTRNFRNVKSQSEDAALYQAGMAIASLQQHLVYSVERNNVYELSE
ncbi:DUF1659 domain-containing protein [Alkalicoccus daliensis]|uniref:DUF1659 domain-containing protein n=1 Tax=Alkalicoccus daliensis TaxID=745820 RepID=A0A1H0CSU3_9BACI|nr:DUF1659 domain-containing protein [Alkalicoccus daliensis]SDN60865.1 Protein of unknown function [Alkalicoccus daliensis]